jgi:hypothetical protein
MLMMIDRITTASDTPYRRSDFCSSMKEKVSRRHLQVKIQKVVKLDTYSKALPLENKEAEIAFEVATPAQSANKMIATGGADPY